MRESVFVVDEIKDIVDKVKVKLSKDVFFQYGGFKEVFENIIQLSTLQNPKTYPLIWLVTDIKEESGVDLDVYCEAELNLLIFNVTKAEYSAPERTEKSFKAVLNPIYESLINEFEYSKRIKNAQNSLLKHSHYKHYSWGRDKIELEKDGKKFSDFIDCIEIKISNLKFKHKNC